MVGNREATRRRDDGEARTLGGGSRLDSRRVPHYEGPITRSRALRRASPYGVKVGSGSLDEDLSWYAATRHACTVLTVCAVSPVEPIATSRTVGTLRTVSPRLSIPAGRANCPWNTAPAILSRCSILAVDTVAAVQAISAVLAVTPIEAISPIARLYGGPARKGVDSLLHVERAKASAAVVEL